MFRIRKWQELTPFQQGYVIGMLRLYALAAGMGLAWWLQR